MRRAAGITLGVSVLAALVVLLARLSSESGGGAAIESAPESSAPNAEPAPAPAEEAPRAPAARAATMAEEERLPALDLDAHAGLVVDERGAPVAGALVLAVDGPAKARSLGPPIAEAHSDEAGRFRLRAPHATHLRGLVVLADGFLPRYLRGAVPGRELRIELEPARPVSGRVVEEEGGTPVPGALLRSGHYALQGGELRQVEARSRADGAFELERGQLAGELALELELECGASLTRTLHLAPDARTGHELRVPALRPLVAHFTDAESGEPLAHLPVELQGRAHTTDGLGRVETQLRASRRAQALELEGGAPGYCHATVELRAPAEGPIELELPLLRAGRLELHVVDRDGGPIPGAWVLVPVVGGSPGSSRVSWRLARSGPRVDASGRAWIDAPPGERHQVIVQAPGHVTALLDELTPRAGETRVRRVELSAGAALTGRVLRAEGGGGEPLHASVHWSTQDGSSGFGSTDDSGGFLVEGVEPGLVSVHAQTADGRAGPTLLVELIEGARASVELLLPPSPVTLSGIVRDAAGAPVAGARVAAYAGERYVGATQSGAGGRFALPLPEPKLAFYRLEANDSNRSASVEGVAAGTYDVVLELPRTALLRLRAFDAASGEPVERVVLYFRRAGEPGFRSARQRASSAAGPLELPLFDGVFDLRASAREAGFADAARDGVALSTAAVQELELPLERATRLTLRLEPAEGQDAVEKLGAFLLVGPLRRAAAGHSECEYFRMTWSEDVEHAEPSGRLLFPAANPGRNLLRPFHPGLVLEPAEFEIPSAPAHELVVRWRKDEGD